MLGGEKLEIPQENMKLYRYDAAKETQEHDCKKEKIRDALQEQAGRVGENGVLFIHFSCHGKKKDDIFYLVPQDFNESKEIWIEPSELLGWLMAAKCEEKRVVLSLDCCYSGGIAKALLTEENLKNEWAPFSACSKNGGKMVEPILDSTIFSYCFSFTIRQVMDASFPIINVFEKMKTAFNSLTSLK